MPVAILDLHTDSAVTTFGKQIIEKPTCGQPPYYRNIIAYINVYYQRWNLDIPTIEIERLGRFIEIEIRIFYAVIIQRVDD